MSRRTISFLWGYHNQEKREKEAFDAKERDPLRVPSKLDRTRNEITTQTYTYDGLSRGSSSLRLMEILPGTRQEDLACRLYETTLDESTGSYAALSYVWGDGAETTPIQINNKTMDIGINLRTALFNLRDLRDPITLWADAICINQGDVKECSQQVVIMGEIYRRATKTIIWLRDQVEGETERAFDLLHKLAAHAEAHRKKHSSSRAERPSDPENMIHLANHPLSLLERAEVPEEFDRYRYDQTIIHVLQSEWWRRSWTTQEILLATKATVVIGTHHIDWDEMCFGGNHGVNLGIWSTLKLGVTHDTIITPYLSLQLMEATYRNSTESPAKLLLELMIQCQFRGAKKPQDKIYSLLGLVTKTSPSGIDQEQAPKTISPLGIRPDYTLSEGSVYSNFAYQMMYETGSLDILGACAAAATPEYLVSNLIPDRLEKIDPEDTHSSHLNLQLPSWVPDWSMVETTVVPLLHDALGRPRKTHAAAQSTYQPHLLEENADGQPTTLLLEAHELTALIDLSDPLRECFNGIAPGLKPKKLKEKDDPNDKGLQKLGRVQRVLLQYEFFMSMVSHLTIFAEWEEFARKTQPTNPRPTSTMRWLTRNASVLSLGPGPITAAAAEMEEEPEDRLAIYWQTLCTGTYPDEAEASTEAKGRGSKIAAQISFYKWRASLKLIRDLHRWQAESKLRPLAFLGYIMKTWNMYSDFLRFLDGSYGRRLARGANGYLCLVPAQAMEGDMVILAKGGRAPLVIRPHEANAGAGEYWQLVGEAYVQGIMNGEAWNETKCQAFKIR
ncbi:hypothetical protein PFICI_12662 [Pestalotiopsis fici W106-1]|uniref:Heterokaryon incompatibility domain-containing protein n=1 Tax=Pestalotiopsis fici (strain W106-1 / CGMCC3.15140) TaxID=1229662 RepID=W3WPD4_PESFW|nr:uncharacterized protein PFICI_12662 [Pestalotiopsis fici W106-1]ETS75718.1 hypothetical protein PFICI_12662 [Pestalotiopsis fici W106-1]